MKPLRPLHILIALASFAGLIVFVGYTVEGRPLSRASVSTMTHNINGGMQEVGRRLRENLATIARFHYGDDQPLTRVYPGMGPKEWRIAMLGIDSAAEYAWSIEIRDTRGATVWNSGAPRPLDVRPDARHSERTWYLGGSYDVAKLKGGEYCGSLTVSQSGSSVRMQVNKEFCFFVDYSDGDYAARVETLLAKEGIGGNDRQSSTLQVTCEDRVVTLRGKVSTHNAYWRAQELALIPPNNRSMGVLRVVNALDVPVAIQ